MYPQTEYHAVDSRNMFDVVDTSSIAQNASLSMVAVGVTDSSGITENVDLSRGMEDVPGDNLHASANPWIPDERMESCGG